MTVNPGEQVLYLHIKSWARAARVDTVAMLTRLIPCNK